MTDQPQGEHSQFALLKSRSFLPLFITQAIGAFNDNGLRNGIAILITFDLAVNQGWNATLFVQAGLALFMRPYFLFSALAGQLADKYDKRRLINFVKCFEVGIMALSAWGFFSADIPILLACVFLMGLHSTLFGPVKFAYLPQHLNERELTGGNGRVEMGPGAC